MMHRHFRRLVGTKKPIEYIGNSIGNGDSGTPSLTISSPSTTQIGDLIVIIGCTRNVTGYLLASSPTGFSAVTGRIGQGSLDVATCESTINGSGSVVITASDSATEFSVQLLVFRYAKWGGIGSVTSITSSVTIPAVTTTADNSYLVAWYGIGTPSVGLTLTVPTDYTLLRASGGASYTRVFSYFKLQSIAGLSTTATSSTSNGNTMAGNHFWLEPL